MIITDENLLRIQCVDVLPEEVGGLRELLERELEYSAALGRPGIGLACPQIGIPKRMAIVRIPSHESLVKIDLVNCEISAGFDETFFDYEGCLSFPGRYERTKRFQEIHITKNLVEPFSFISAGIIAVCCQHELDHLCGVLLPDLAT